jgi:hypothetical protein
MSRDHVRIGRYESGKAGGARAATPVHPVLALQRSIGNGAVASLLQRTPARRVTENPTRPGKRLKGKPAEIIEKHAALRMQHRDDAHAVLNGLEFDHLWGGSKSDVTGDDEEHSVRIDRQNPTRTHSNIQIQTNGISISIATVLVADTLAATRDQRGVVNAVRQAFRSSLADGMQWEVYDAPDAEKVEPRQGKGKGPDRGGDKGKKGKGPGKGRGGGGGQRGRQIPVQ